MRQVRRVIVVVFYFGCAAAVFYAGVTLFALVFGAHDFTDLSGRRAKGRLGDAWPSIVDASVVQLVSYKYEASMDSDSSWYRIQLPKDAATQWMDHIHAKQERDSKSILDHHHEGLEGVHRTIVGPPSMQWRTGDTPHWWSPPEIEFRATEIMLWYRNYHSGVGHATYSVFDESTSTLWIYDYRAQHNKLWSHGDVPKGTPIGLAAKTTPKSSQQ